MVKVIRWGAGSLGFAKGHLLDGWCWGPSEAEVDRTVQNDRVKPSKHSAP